MKSTILISRIMRVIETEGAIGDGSALAEEYAAAVRQVNSRLEAVQTAIDAKQVSDAVRMMEDAPRLLDEIGALDFNQLPDWEVLCSRNHWATPIKFDKALLERVLMLNESTEVVEPFLRMYRKAVRTNNNNLAVQSLRRLVQLDHTQNWKINLVQAEEAAQKQIVAAFRVAKETGKKGEMRHIAQEFLETVWTEAPTSRGIEEIRAFVAEEKAEQRDVEGAEDVDLLRRCAGENWNRPLVVSMLQAIDGLVGQGFVLSADDVAIVNECRKRCADEIEAEDRERHWKDLCERLHAAIQQENTAAIRDVLSAPEFLDRDPDPDLIKQAQLVIQHEEAARKRKMLQIAVCAMVGLFAILGVSGWWLRQKLFNDRCEGEAIKLAALQKGPHAVDRLTEALRKLQDDDPEVYADPRVNVFDGELKTMRSQMNARTNEIAAVLAELTSLREAKWGDNIDSVISRFERIEQIITKDDDAFRPDFLALKSAWTDHCEEMDATNRNTATKFHKTLVSHVKTISERLRSELLSDELAKEVSDCRNSIAEWKRVHAQYVPALEGAVDESEKSLAEAESMQKNLRAAVKKLALSASAKEYLEERRMILEYYFSYPFVKCIGDHPISPADVENVTANASAEQKSFANLLQYGIGETAFKKFITDNVTSLSEIPSYYSLYGLGLRDDRYGNYFAVCKGKPQIKKPSYDAKYQIDGELLNFSKGEMVQQMVGTASRGKPYYTSLLPSDEIKNIVDIAGQSNITLLKFEQEIVKIIAEHLRAAGESDFLKNEVEIYGKQCDFATGRYPAIRRVQLLQLYCTWLREDLKLLPPGSGFVQWLDRIENLAQPIRVENIPEDLTWTCMREKRVRQRNSECARLLSQMAAENLIEEYRAWEKARVNLRRIVEWQIEFAGSVSFNPYDARWMNDHSVVLPSLQGSVKKDHPLYVLRKDGERFVLKRALEPGRNNGAWTISAGMTKELLTGDPLFQISDHGKHIDAEENVRAILKEMPEKMSKQFSEKIPLFNLEAK